MHRTDSPPVTQDEIDDLVYLARVNEAQELQQFVEELSQTYKCSRRSIISAAIDPESGNTILHYCSANGFARLLQTLLNGLKSNDVTNGEASEIELNLVLVNTANKQGNTALHWAAYNGQLEAVKILIDAGANMWLKNTTGQVALYEAERADKRHVILYLLEAGMKETRENPENVPSARDIGFAGQRGEASAANGEHETNGSAALEIKERVSGS